MDGNDTDNEEMDDGEEDEIDDDDEEEEEESEDDNEDNDEEEEIEAVIIMEKFICTFHNGDYDAEFDDLLSYDRGVIPLVQSTQASYNKPDNWVERNRIGLEKVKRQLQTCIESVSREPKFELELIHNNQWAQELIDNKEPIVWHAPILDAYWDQLEAKIDRRKQQEIVTDNQRIRISNVEMKKERLAALLAIFRHGSATNSSTYLDFDNANLCEEGIVCLSKVVEISSQLQILVIRHNRIDNMESALCLSRSLKLYDLGRSPEILSVILQSDISFIDLENNNIDSLGAVEIAEYLESDPPIEHLSLDHNHLNDNDAAIISQALKRSTNLRQLDLLLNNITSIGVKALLTCVFDSSSLNAISESNHTLVGMYIFSKINNKRLQRCIDRLLELDQLKFQKIVLALQDKDSLLKYLANVPVELIPEVLAFSRQEVYDRPLHKCNMPMLYSYFYNCCADVKRKRDY